MFRYTNAKGEEVILDDYVTLESILTAMDSARKACDYSSALMTDKISGFLDFIMPHIGIRWYDAIMAYEKNPKLLTERLLWVKVEDDPPPLNETIMAYTTDLKIVEMAVEIVKDETNSYGLRSWLRTTDGMRFKDDYVTHWALSNVPG